MPPHASVLSSHGFLQSPWLDSLPAFGFHSDWYFGKLTRDRRAGSHARFNGRAGSVGNTTHYRKSTKRSRRTLLLTNGRDPGKHPSVGEARLRCGLGSSMKLNGATKRRSRGILLKRQNSCQWES